MDDKELHNLLFSSIQHHNDTLLSDLLENESGKRLLDLPGQNGNMLLHAAVMENDLRCVECLLKHGTNPNVFDTFRARTPLHLAVELGLTEIVRTILELPHVNLDIRDDRNLTSYEIAQFCDNQNLADLIKVRSDEINQLKDDFYSVVNQACISNEPSLVRELLERYENKIIDKLPRGWLPQNDGKHFARASIKELINWSSSSWNDVTLLFKSASKGHTEICRLLIEYGATAKRNENTNYSPLYVAAYGGYTDTVKLLLDNFPSLIQEVTIEKWTVLHACCLQGHSDTAKLILTYPYLEELKRRYVSRSGIYEYYFGFDLNAQDAAGQTVIYLAVSANDEKLLDTLLHYNVEAKLLDTPANNAQSNNVISSKLQQNNSSNRQARIIPDRPKHKEDVPHTNIRTNKELDKIIRQLKKIDTAKDSSISAETKKNILGENKYLICPFEMDTYCDYNSKTALHLAVCQQYHSIVTTLLVNGSNPNLPILSRDSIKSEFNHSNTETGLNWLRSSKSTCLKEACRLNDEAMCEILIRYGASDDQDNLALQVAASNKNNSLVSKFLALKSSTDPEYKINKKCNVEFAARYKQNRNQKLSHSNVITTFSSMFPSTPVMIDWQNLKCIKRIDPQWLIDASLVYNKRLKHTTTSLIAITRLDLSSNNLKSVNPVIFRLPSLRELNLSKNRIESLLDHKQRNSIEGDSTFKLIESHRIAMKRSKSSNLSTVNLESSNIIDLDEPQEWDLPYLEILDLHDNRLISLPDCLFELPKLSELDVSSNQIRQLPWSMWTAPSLKEVIASKNLLDDLPRVPPQSRISTNLSHQLQCDISIDEKTSTNSNQSPSTERFDNSFMSSTGSDSNKDDFHTHNLDSISDITTERIESIMKPVNHLNYWKKKIDLVSNTNINTRFSEDDLSENNELCGLSKITYLNLSHNSLTAIPPVLACITTELFRLNFSHNRIKELGDINLYPAKLKNLDLSNNQIESWFTLFQDQTDVKHCFVDNSRRESSNSRFLYNQNGLCCHKSHPRLDNLKSLNLSHNLLKDIQLRHPQLKPDANSSKSLMGYNSEQDSQSNLKYSLYYPSVTALDLSFNKIQQVPSYVSELKDLSVLNLSGNVSIASLPAELGLANKLWNLGITGCNLSGPLKSVVESKTYKTMDIIGYLKSILEEAKPYARMKLMLVGLQGIGKTSLLEQMRHEGSSGSRRRAPEHWTKRMGHSSKASLRNQKGVTLSTVGVDIHDWIYCKRTVRNQTNHGPVSFSTWDFGGQNEFYATHRYFLSRRSMYLVVWKLTDGLNGISGIQQWLVNIQSRASGSPVIIVGTHEDLIEGGEQGEIVQQLQSEVFKKFINISDHDKCGLPRVFDSIVVSTKTKLNIKHLCNRIYDVVFSLKSPGSTERLLEQKIPATYLYLEEIVNLIVHDRQQKKREPVLTYEEYRKSTSDMLKSKYNKRFRDLESIDSSEINYNSELQQATRFLHENGVLLHYEDSNLRDLYFLDPQWLCDILSHVVTIREINPHVKNGLMKIEDLGFLFKSMEFNLNGGIQSYVVNLLNKFEVALTWNSQYLLIPSLLPSSPDSIDEHSEFQVKMVPRMRGRSAVRRYEPNRTTLRATSIEPSQVVPNNQRDTKGSRVEIYLQPGKTIYRLVLLRYLPAGFLARLQSGILSDPIYDDICADLHLSFTNNPLIDSNIDDLLGGFTGWTCWKNGIKLTMQHESTINCKAKLDSSHPILTISEFSTDSKQSNFKQKDFKIESLQIDSASSNSDESITSKWCDLDLKQYSNILLVTVPNWSLKITNNDGSVKFIQSDQQCIAKLLANSVDHIDNLLEDWYPSLGTRFAHTLGGNYLVTRIIPCISCFSNQALGSHNQRFSRADNRGSKAGKINFTINTIHNNERDTNRLNNLNDLMNENIHCYYVEHCILNAYNIADNVLSGSQMRKNSLSFMKSKKSHVKNLYCPKHGSINLSHVAPDILFNDIPDYIKLDNDQVERCKLIGRGTFGFVFKGILCDEANSVKGDQEVALKLLQPADPGPEAEHNDMVAYKSAKSNWQREPFHCACKSYCIARHEVNILQTLRHPNIVLFIGICIRPLAIILELAPLGCLTDIFKNYKRAAMQIDQYSIQKSILQIAKALEFLHQQRVIYRDLKAENVLVWSFPSPLATRPQAANVELKLADYGISRQASSTGIWKGFAGTINFLAPEILRHNGDEEYTEKVDCFSFGMFLFEILTLRPPFKHNEGTKNHLADGYRPSLSARDMIYPDHFVDLMSVCWSQEPHNRPTTSQIVTIASTPEFMQLLDVAVIDSLNNSKYHGAVQYIQNDEYKLELWLTKKDLKIDVLTANDGHWIECDQLIINRKIQPTCFCFIENKVWLCDDSLTIHVLQMRGSEHQSEVLNQSQSFSLNLIKKSSLREMLYVRSAHCILMLFADGQLWFCHLDTMRCQQLDDGSTKFECIALQEDAAKIRNSCRFSVFCGHQDGITVLEVTDYEISHQMILPLAGKLFDLSGERIVDSTQSSLITNIVSSEEYIWTSAGCTVHLWSVKDKRVARKLDCWKLVPCSESLESINIEVYYQQARSSFVSSMVYLNNQLFVGTSFGCFMIIEADTLKPIIVFKPYESDMTILAPNDPSESARYLITIGSGYRDVLKRFVNSLDDSTVLKDVAILWNANYYN